MPFGQLPRSARLNPTLSESQRNQHLESVTCRLPHDLGLQPQTCQLKKGFESKPMFSGSQGRSYSCRLGSLGTMTKAQKMSELHIYHGRYTYLPRAQISRLDLGFGGLVVLVLPGGPQSCQPSRAHDFCFAFLVVGWLGCASHRRMALPD